ncbi:PXA domain-containing protein [Aspergillus falconensis]
MDAPNDASHFQSDQTQRTERPICDESTRSHQDDRLITANIDGTLLKQSLDSALHLLSTCSNEKLLFILVCLMGATYMILGRLGLLLIGTTLGVALHASWEGLEQSHSSKYPNIGRKQLSLSIVHKLLDWEGTNPVKADLNARDVGETHYRAALGVDADISSLGPITAGALHSLIDAAMRDYVNSWYESILPSEATFPNACRAVFTSFIASIASHLYRKRAADTVLEFLINSSSIVIVFLNELSAAFQAAGPNVAAKDAVLQYVESNPESSLSSLLAHRQQHQKLQTISDDLLSRYLDSNAYDCILVRNFLREVLTGIAFESAVTSMSRPEFINGWIVYLFSEGESEIMSAIDAGVEGARNHGVAAAKDSGEISRPASISGNGSVAEGSISANYSPSVPGQVFSKVDQATEEAMLEAKRLSDMIAEQNIPKHTEQTTQNDIRAKCDTRDDDIVVANAGAESSVEEQQSIAAIEAYSSSSAQDAQDVKSREPGDSLTSPSLQSMETIPSSSLGSIDISPASTLFHASVTVDDGCDSRDKATLRSKPTSNYLIQVEPHSGRSSGWMVFKRYADFEAIHETLVTIARLNQLRFGESHPLVPPWKGRTHQDLARDLELYLQEALQLEPLAESVTMRRFLEKDGGLGSEVVDWSGKPGFVFPGQATFENVGKGVLGVLTNAPKGVSGGSKAVIDSVSGVFGGGLSKKSPVALGTEDSDDTKAHGAPHKHGLALNEGNSKEEGDLKLSSDIMDGALSAQQLKTCDTDGFASSSESAFLAESSNTPVPTPESEGNTVNEADDQLWSVTTSADQDNPKVDSAISEEKNSKDIALVGNGNSTESPAGQESRSNPITRDETRVAVELIFAVINELYSLSSAWNIRRTLLNAAKSYILRPANPSLETIRRLLQDSMIDRHTTDEAVGIYLTKLRENALPTPEELNSWPGAMSDAEKERQREAARRILLQKGLPKAITGVMGAGASGEALGKVFDSLQIDIVARGFVFSILLQALRAIVF